MFWGREEFKPKLFFISDSNAPQRRTYRRTWYLRGWVRKIAVRLVKKTHTPCIEFSESKWFYRIQYSHLLSINVRKPGWNKK